MITGGHNLGRVGTITHRERHPGSFDIVHIKDALGHTFATRYEQFGCSGISSFQWYRRKDDQALAQSKPCCISEESSVVKWCHREISFSRSPAWLLFKAHIKLALPRKCTKVNQWETWEFPADDERSFMNLLDIPGWTTFLSLAKATSHGSHYHVARVSDWALLRSETEGLLPNNSTSSGNLHSETLGPFWNAIVE